MQCVDEERVARVNRFFGSAKQPNYMSRGWRFPARQRRSGSSVFNPVPDSDFSPTDGALSRCRNTRARKPHGRVAWHYGSHPPPRPDKVVEGVLGMPGCPLPLSWLAIHKPLSDRFAISPSFLGKGQYGPTLLAQGNNLIEHGLSTLTTAVSFLNDGRRHPWSCGAVICPDRRHVVRERSPNLAYEPVALFYRDEHTSPIR